MTLEERIKENIDALFKSLNKEPVSPYKHEWQKRPEASYFQLIEYMRKRNEVCTFVNNIN